jgi:hypothetical protein
MILSTLLLVYAVASSCPDWFKIKYNSIMSVSTGRLSYIGLSLMALLFQRNSVIAVDMTSAKIDRANRRISLAQDITAKPRSKGTDRRRTEALQSEDPLLRPARERLGL